MFLRKNFLAFDFFLLDFFSSIIHSSKKQTRARDSYRQSYDYQTKDATSCNFGSQLSEYVVFEVGRVGVRKLVQPRGWVTNKGNRDRLGEKEAS